MSTKPNNTDNAAKKIIRSHLSQAYANAVEGIYVNDQNVQIEPTKLQEPSILKNQTEIDLAPFGATAQEASSVSSLASFTFTKETVDDLIALLDMRALEKYTDNYISAGYTKSKSIIEWVNGGRREKFENSLDEVKTELEKVKGLYKERADFVHSLQGFVINTQRRKILDEILEIPPGAANPSYTPLSDEKTRTYKEFWNIFSPHARTLMCNTSVQIKKDVYLTPDLFAGATLPLIAPQLNFTDNLKVRDELNTLLGFELPYSRNFEFDNTFHTTSIILCAIDLISKTIDHGFTPGHFYEPSNLYSVDTSRPIDTRLITRPGSFIPELKDIGMYEITRASDVPVPIVAAAVTPQDIGVDPDFIPDDPLKPNFIHGHDYNPAVRVMRCSDALVKEVRHAIGVGIDPHFSTGHIHAISHILSMVKSEALLSSGIETDTDSGDYGFPSVNERFNPVSKTLNGVGETLFGKPGESSLSEGQDGFGRLTRIVSSTADPLLSVSLTGPFLPFEKGLLENNLDPEKRDIYDAYLKDVLNPEASDEDRERLIQGIKKTYQPKMKKINSAIDVVSKLYSYDKVSKNLTLSSDDISNLRQWQQDNAEYFPESPKHHPNGGISEILGHMLSSPISRVEETFRRNQEVMGFPLSYWGGYNSVGVRNDRDVIAQIIGLVRTVNESSLSPNTIGLTKTHKENLRSAIVESIIDRDLLMSTSYSADLGAIGGVARSLGYHLSIANKKVQRARYLNASTSPVDGYQMLDDYVNPLGNNVQAVKNSVRYGTLTTLGPEYFYEFNADEELILYEPDEILAAAQETAGAGIGSLDDSGNYLRTLYWPPNYRGAIENFDVGAGQIFELDQGVTKVQAGSYLYQGDVDYDGYRVTKYENAQDFVSAVLGKRSSSRWDLYDYILWDVDQLDRFFVSNHGRLKNPQGPRALVDESFNTFAWSALGIKEGYYIPNAGSSKAHAFDRSTLVSIVVDIYARVLSTVFRVDLGTSAQGADSSGDSLKKGLNFDVFPLVAEIRTQNGDWSDGFDRNRFLDSFKVNNGVGSYLPIRTHTIEKQARIFKSIKFTLNDLNYELFSQDDSRDSSGLGALIARNACKPSEQLVQWTRVPQNVNIDAGVVAYPTFQIPIADSFGSPSPGVPPGFEYLPYTHNTPFVNPTLIHPFGSNHSSFFSVSFGLTTTGFEIGNTPAATYLKAVADSSIFASQQEGAPMRGLLALHKLVTKFYRPAYDLSKRYEEFKEKKRSLNIEEGSNLSCNDVSKHQIASKLSFINTVQRRIDDFGEESHLAGGYTYQEVSAFNFLAKKFLEDLKKRMDDEGVSYKNYRFYGLKPNFSYGKLIAESEKLGENVYFYHRRSSTSELEPYGVTLDIRYEGKSGIDSDIRYKNKGDYGDYYDLDHKVVEGVLYRKLKDFLEDDSISSDSYEKIVARIPLLRIRSTDSQGLKNGSLYAGTSADNYLEKFYRTYDKTFTDTSVSPDFALHLFKQKIDSWCLKYIINQVTGMTLDEDHLGLNKRGLNKSRYEAILRLSNRDLDEEYFSFNDDSRQSIEQLPYDDKFKRNLRPSLQVEEGDVAPKIMPPKITNSDIILGQLVANSNIARDYRSLRDLKFDEVIAVPFHPRQKLLVDGDTTDPRFLDENGSVKEGFATIENNGLFIINPVCRIKIWTAPPPNNLLEESQGIVDLINQGFVPGGLNGLL